MPVKYIAVTASSDLFVPATRAFGDIAIIGKGAANSAASSPAEFTEPSAAAVQYPSGSPGAVTDLAAAIAIAFRQTPPPTRVWGVQVDASNPDWDGALTEVAGLNVQIVALANTPLNQANADLVGKLSTHVTDVSNTGGDGKERIGVAMLDPTLTAAEAAALNTGTVKNERMFLIAHTSAEDAAAATCGVIAGYEPQISMLLKPISLNMPKLFTDADIDTLDGAAVNWVTSPVLIPGQSLFLGEGYTADPSHNKKYVDIVRVIDKINFQIKAELIQAIGNFRVSRSGLRGIVTLIQAVLAPLVASEVIEDFTVFIPLLVLLDKDPATLSAAELGQIQGAQASRTVDLTIAVTYAGAIHRMQIELVFQ